jgi:hypothetical protein
MRVAGFYLGVRKLFPSPTRIVSPIPPAWLLQQHLLMLLDKDAATAARARLREHLSSARVWEPLPRLRIVPWALKKVALRPPPAPSAGRTR